MNFIVHFTEPLMREKHELVQLCFTRAEDDDLTITLFKMLSDDAVDAVRILERAAQLLVFLDELGMFLLFAYLVDGDLTTRQALSAHRKGR